jgi:hypothetical protein
VHVRATPRVEVGHRSPSGSLMMMSSRGSGSVSVIPLQPRAPGDKRLTVKPYAAMAIGGRSVRLALPNIDAARAAHRSHGGTRWSCSQRCRDVGHGRQGSVPTRR